MDSVTRTGRRRPALPVTRAVGVAALVAALDLVTAFWAQHSLAAAPSGHSSWALALVHNHGIAFGIAANHPLVAAAVEMIGVLVAGWWLGAANSDGGRLCAAAVLGGGVGNLVNRLAAGSVTDWIHVAGFPPYFDVSDVAIRCGLLVALVLVLRDHVRRPGSPTG